MINDMGKILTINCRGIWTIKKTDISKMWMDTQQHIPKSIWGNQEHNQEENYHDILQ